MIELRGTIVHPAEMPVECGERMVWARMTHGRILRHVDYDKMERRAKYVLRAAGGRLGDLEGSQFRSFQQQSYYTEVTAHELAHCGHYDIVDKKPLEKLDFALKHYTTAENDENEVRTNASTMLVLEYLGMPYDPYWLMSAAARNMRMRFITSSHLYPEVLAAREEPKVQQVARQITYRLLKIKYDEAREARVLPGTPAAP